MLKTSTLMKTCLCKAEMLPVSGEAHWERGAEGAEEWDSVEALHVKTLH